ncbi:hypothetical protein Aple_084340 [Acrocarpospora pleiomorpha]|uniref:Uncharacterized protein n=1 Tax=Acrocarpospora pleiomorpha TaxID=90975 RepID=A0A5M3XWI9_9ACTN|nr:hypothetical protein [Acrocarpospora pleiomorpha]GES25535.1 hypothetical protein Aple_084340 [Acrocarpospora pleiomorpha]
MVMLVAACTQQADNRPLGDVVVRGAGCELLAEQAVRLSTGVENLRFDGQLVHGQPFPECEVHEKLDDVSEGDLLLAVDLQEPVTNTAEQQVSSRLKEGLPSIPADIGKGVSGSIRDSHDDQVIGIFAQTFLGTRLLTIEIYKEAPGRDRRADAIEFLRQLRPVLLAPFQTSSPPS